MRSGLIILNVLILLATAEYVNAQEFQFSGKVIDKDTKEPLIGVKISSDVEVTLRGLTDMNGMFSIPSKFETAVFEITYNGYEAIKLELSVHDKALISLQESSYELDEVNVRGDKSNKKEMNTLPQTYIKKDELSRNSSTKLGDVVAAIDGVTFASTGSNIQLPVIHGLYGNRILVLNNGFTQGFQNWGSDHAPEVDVSGAERIRVVKGAAGVKYGPEALGGALVIENNDLNFNNKFYGDFTSSYQTNGRGYGINAAIGQGLKNFSYHIGGNYNKVGDRHAPSYNLTNTGFEEYAYQGGVKFRKGKWTAQANYSAIRQNLGILRAAIGSSGPALIKNFEAEIPTYIKEFSYAINEPNQIVTHQLAAGILTRYLENGNIELRFARQWNARREWDVRRNADLPVLDLELTTDEVQLEWNHEWNKRFSGSWGVNYFSQFNRNNPGTLVTPFIPNFRLTRISGFMLERMEVQNGRWELGVRYDFDTREVSGRTNAQQIFRDNFDFHNLTASIGYQANLNKNTTFTNNIGTGWRPPNMHELYAFGQHEARTTFGLLRYVPDSDSTISAKNVTLLNQSNVRPENSIKYTSELEWIKRKHRLNITGYSNYIRNFTFHRPIGVLSTARGPMPTFVVDQADALFLGADLTYSYSYHKNGKVTFGASYIWSRNVQRNEHLINQPPIHLHTKWTQSWQNVGPLDKLEISIRPSYTFRQFQAPRVISIRDLVEGNVSLSFNDPIFDFMAPPAGYFLVNSYVKMQKGKFSLSVEGRNILNQEYRDYLNSMRYYANDLGLNVLFSLAYKF
ncbi:MAG: TonB-dependent receptor plug domain-containing protein [Crocinitomicaceae bacterium]|nr:TonB-dependent receptor plug domain-containing protein [Crocinitomicaceae bacterium]